MIPVASQYRFTSLDEDIKLIFTATILGADRSVIVNDPDHPNSIRQRAADVLEVMKELGIVVSHHQFRFVDANTNECVFILKGE